MARTRRPPAMNAIPPIDVEAAFRWAANPTPVKRDESKPYVIQCRGCWRCMPGKYERPKTRTGKRSKTKTGDDE